ncbi:MAG TPA: hypothetical protein VFJ43_01430 [Bacteroidia bacterium]|nr:hypothetical protein [Bacteroidia bacterium]
MNKFLFITHITPTTKRSEFRQALIDVYFAALRNQTYPDWKAIVFGEEEKVEDKFHYFTLADESREKKFEAIKNLLQRAEVESLLDEADYIIKLDDDDLISPVLLEHLKNFKGDLYYDRFHTFFDSSSGVITQQERQWVASTCVHKKELILSDWNGTGASPVGNLLYTDHSKAWHLFYGSKNKTAAPKESPVYLRILSPTSITSGALNGPPQSIKDVTFDKYYEYLSGFGNWDPAPVHVFDPYLGSIAAAWQKFSGEKQKALPSMKKKTPFLKKLFGKS